MLSNSKAPNNKRLAQEANQILEQHVISTATSGAVFELEDPDEVLAIRANPKPHRAPQQQRQLRQQQQQPARPRLCANHFRFGDRAYTCHGGDCPSRHEPLAPRPTGNSAPPRASGNGRAGR